MTDLITDAGKLSVTLGGRRYGKTTAAIHALQEELRAALSREAALRERMTVEGMAKVLFFHRYNVKWEDAHYPSKQHSDARQDAAALLKYLEGK